MDTPLIIAVALASAGVGVLIFISFQGVIDILRGKVKQPPLQHILDALRPFVHNGLLAAEQYAQDVFTATNTYIDDIDKKDIADKFYNILPATIVIYGIAFPIGLVKHWVSQADFERLVESEYEAFRAVILANEAYLTKDLPKVPPPNVKEPNRAYSMGSNAGQILTGNASSTSYINPPEGSA